jgi:hypothetical protein
MRDESEAAFFMLSHVARNAKGLPRLPWLRVTTVTTLLCASCCAEFAHNSHTNSRARMMGVTMRNGLDSAHKRTYNARPSKRNPRKLVLPFRFGSLSPDCCLQFTHPEKKGDQT